MIPIRVVSSLFIRQLLFSVLILFSLPNYSLAQSRATVVPIGDGAFLVIPIPGFVTPENIGVMQTGVTSLLFSWSESVGASAYRLERYVNGDWVVLYHGGDQRFTLSSLPTGDLIFRLSACDDQDRCGQPSESLMVRVVTTQSIDYVYDALGRLKQVTDPNNGNRVYNYDKAGNRTSVSAQ